MRFPLTECNRLIEASPGHWLNEYELKGRLAHLRACNSAARANEAQRARKAALSARYEPQAFVDMCLRRLARWKRKPQ